MQLMDRTILITGGSEGIGFELAKALVPNNTVIICGRSQAKLAAAKQALPRVVTMACDVTEEVQLQALAAETLATYPKLSILINNAGGRQPIDVIGDRRLVSARNADLALNFTAPVAVCQHFMQHLRAQPSAAIVNVTTGLIYLPKAAYPFYCAAKAALHSYTLSLRWALRGTNLSVFEALMPLVDTNFHQGDLPKTTRAMSAKAAAEHCLKGIAADLFEIHVGKSKLMRWLALLVPQKGMAIINSG